MRLSVITPAFNEASNLKALHARLAAVLDGEGIEWDWLIVDDHSRDETFAVASAIAAADARVDEILVASPYYPGVETLADRLHRSGLPVWESGVLVIGPNRAGT